MNGGYGGHAYGGGGEGNVNMNGYGLLPYGSEPGVSAAAAARPTSISDPYEYYGNTNTNTNTNINAHTNTALSFSQNPNIATGASASLHGHGHGHGGHVHSRQHQHQHQRQTHLSLNSHSNSQINGTGVRNMNGHNNSSAASYAHNSSAAYSHGNSNSHSNANANVNANGMCPSDIRTSTTHRQDVYEQHNQYPHSSHQQLQQQQRPPSLSNIHDQNHSLETIKNSMNGNGGNGSMLTTYTNSDVNGVNGVNGNQHINASINGNGYGHGHGHETNNTHTHRAHGDINSSSVNANTSYTDNQKRSNSNSNSNKKATNINNATMNMNNQMNMDMDMGMGKGMNMNSKVNIKHRTTDTRTPVTDNTTNSNMNMNSTSTNNYNPGTCTSTGTAGTGNDTKTDTAMESDDQDHDHDHNQPQTHDPYCVNVTITTAPKYAKAATIHKSNKANRRAQFKHRMEHFYKHCKDLKPRDYFRSRISSSYRNPNAYANLNNGFGGNRIGHGIGHGHDNGTVDTGSNEPGNERLNPTLAHSYHSHCLKECQRNVESLKIMIQTTASVAEVSRSLEIRNQSKSTSNGKVNEINGGGSDKLRNGVWNGAEHGNGDGNGNGAVDKDTMRGLLTGVETPEIQAEHNNKNAYSNANGHGTGTVTVTGNQNELLASNVPSAFPKELTFRALAVYTTLRTLSGNYQGGNGGAGADQVKLLLSPYTPIAFLRALSLPHSCTILNQTMVQILRILYAHQGIGQYDKRGDGWARFKLQIPMAATKKREEGVVSEYIQRRDRMLYTDVIANDGDGDDPDDRGSGGENKTGSEKERGFGGILDGGRGDESGEEVETGRIYGGDNLTYLNEATWPLYYMDYFSAYGIDPMSLENGVSGLEGIERENGHDSLNGNVNDHDIVDANELDDELLDIRTPEIDALFKNRPSEIPLSECEAPYKTFPWMTAMAIAKRKEDAIANVSTNVNTGQQSSNNEYPGSRSRSSSSRAGPKASSSTNSSKIKRKSTLSRKRRKRNSTAEDHSSDEDSEYEEPEARQKIQPISGFTPSGRKRKLGEQPTNYSRTDERNVEGLTNGAPPSGAIPRKQKSSRIKISIPRKGNVQTQNRKYGYSQSQMFCESERNPRGVTKGVYDDIYDLLNTDNIATSSANNGRDASPGDTNEEEDHISGSGMNDNAVKVEDSVVMKGGKSIDIEMDVKSEPHLENETTVIKEEPRPSLEDQEVARYAFNGSLTMTNNIEEEPALDAGDECKDEKKSEEAEKSALAPLSNDDNIEQKANGGQNIQMKIMRLLKGGMSHYNLNAEMKLSIIE